jgi:cardiolipin synthase (CMP-forming)
MDRWLRQLPNLVSSIRILLAVPIALTLAHHQFITTLWLFGAAAGSDALDGFLAKRFGWQTELGGMLDPVADKLMLATVFVMLALLGDVPIWLRTTVIARDCIIVLGAINYRVWIGPVEARPSLISKLNTACQLVFILAVIGRRQFSWPPLWVVSSLGALVFVTVVISGIDYVLVYGRQAAERIEARHGETPPTEVPPSEASPAEASPVILRSGGDRPQDDSVGARRKAPGNSA